MKIIETNFYSFKTPDGRAVAATGWRTDDGRLIVATLEAGRLVSIEIRDLSIPYSAPGAEASKAGKAK